MARDHIRVRKVGQVFRGGAGCDTSGDRDARGRMRRSEREQNPRASPPDDKRQSIEALLPVGQIVRLILKGDSDLTTIVGSRAGSAIRGGQCEADRRATGSE